MFSQSWQTFSVKDQILIISGFVSQDVSVATTQLCCCSKGSKVNGCDYAPIKLCFLKQTAAQNLAYKP